MGPIEIGLAKASRRKYKPLVVKMVKESMTMARKTTPSLLADRSMPNTSGWQDRHDEAIYHAGIASAPHRLLKQEFNIATMISSWAAYAETYKKDFEGQVGDDYVLGPHWESIGDGLRGLLNGDTGSRLDCGTLDGFILDTMQANGVETENK